VCGLIASPAFADVSNFTSVWGAGYSNTSGDGLSHANDWSFVGSVAVDTDWLHNMSVQGDASYQSLTLRYSGDGDDGGEHTGDWSLAISPFWRMDWGRFGVNLGAQKYTYNGYYVYDNGATSSENAGLFAEWYLGPNLTLAGKGGWWEGDERDYYGDTYHDNGGYVGGQAIWYAMPDLAVTGTIDYVGYKGGYNETNYGATAEWLVSETTPISIYGGWMGTSFSHGGGSVNTWLVGVKVYTDQNGSSTLVDRQRSGSSTWDTKFNPTGLATDY
jgi:hypothetical protein